MYPMRVFVWTKDFHVHRDSSLVPAWVSLPMLPIHFHDKHSLFSILSPVGKPLFLDLATAAGMRPSAVRACVEIDLLKPICGQVWVTVEGENGSWQKIVIDELPKCCSNCWRLGHSMEECTKNNVEVGTFKSQNQKQPVYHVVQNASTKVVETAEKPAMEANLAIRPSAIGGDGLQDKPTSVMPIRDSETMVLIKLGSQGVRTEASTYGENGQVVTMRQCVLEVGVNDSESERLINALAGNMVAPSVLHAVDILVAL
ncbi:uncharacterized protein LOC113777035 [Coffea eugenioides]|uniref:uncharacterized protein LOC113777035 n=1 Tax=Coffea eugenioides TaxID=49369 RepID=UPI000F613897|nr:uncharacterized protein LOC113777035 [Coffea eugenioides]